MNNFLCSHDELWWVLHIGLAEQKTKIQKRFYKQQFTTQEAQYKTVNYADDLRWKNGVNV